MDGIGKGSRPRRARARPSVAVQGKLEGQQVHCTLPNMQKMSSTSSRFESCGEMKSQNSSLQLGAQEGEGDESSRMCLDFGFKAQDVMAAADILDDAERRQVADLGYSTFLNLKLGTICERKETYLCTKLVDLEEDRIKVQLQKDVIGYITPDEIYHLLTLPRGDKAPLKYNKQQQKDFAQLRAELGDPKMSLDIADILELMKREDKKHLRDMASLKHYDMCAIVYGHLRESIGSWKTRTLEKSNKSMTLPGCIIIIVGFIVDNLKLTDIVDKKCPRLNQYDMVTLMRVIGNAKRYPSRISFDKFELKALKEICYAESSRYYIQSPVDSQDSAVVTSGVPPVTQMFMPMQLIQQARGLLSAVQNAQSIGIDQEAVDACIAGLSAIQPLGLARSDVGPSCSISEDAEAASAMQPLGLARSDVGTSCSISEDAEAANTKKVVHEEEISCSSDGVNGNSTEISGIAEAAKSNKSAPRKKLPAVGPTRISLRLQKQNAEAVTSHGALAGSVVISPIKKPSKKQAKKR